MDLSTRLHPSIYGKLDALERRMAEAAERGEADPRLEQIIDRHREIWWDAYGARFKRLLVGFVATASVLTIGLLLGEAGHLVGMALLMTVGLFGGAAGVALARNRREVVPAELRNLVDALELGPGERAYCEALASLGENGLIGEARRDALAIRLTALLEAHRGLGPEARGEHARLAGVIEQTLLRARDALADLDRSAQALEEGGLDDLDAQLEEVVSQTEALDAALEAVPLPALGPGS